VNAIDEGVCPAARETRFDGVHGGRNAGRACWAVPDTLCPKRVGGPRASRSSCLLCAFYDAVLEEETCAAEGRRFVFTPEMLRRLDATSPEFAELGEIPPRR
jgi:hypothetical protein